MRLDEAGRQGGRRQGGREAGSEYKIEGKSSALVCQSCTVPYEYAASLVQSMIGG